MSNTDLISTVWVRDENSYPVMFQPGDTIPDWARKQMGAHCFTQDAGTEHDEPQKKPAHKRAAAK